MELREWVKQTPGARSRLSERTGFAWTTVHAIVRGVALAKHTTAVKISEATGGEVSVGEVFAAYDEDEARKSRKRAARRKASKARRAAA